MNEIDQLLDDATINQACEGAMKGVPREVIRHLPIGAVARLLAVARRGYNHLDGCSHGYPDELWDEYEAVLAMFDDQPDAGGRR